MSKRKLVVSLAVGLALVAAGWWAAKSFWLMPPPAYSAQMIAYGVAHQIADTPAISLRLGGFAQAPGRDQIMGPEPVSMPVAPYTPLAKKNKVKGDLVALLDVDASGSVAGVREMTFHYYSSEGARLANNSGVTVGFGNSVLHTAHSWKFKPAMEKGEPVPATVIVQVRF